MPSGDTHDILGHSVGLLSVGFLYWLGLVWWYCLAWGLIFSFITYAFPPDFFDIKCKSGNRLWFISWIPRLFLKHRKQAHWFSVWFAGFTIIYVSVVAACISAGMPFTENLLLLCSVVFAGMFAGWAHIALDKIS